MSKSIFRGSEPLTPEEEVPVLTQEQAQESVVPAVSADPGASVRLSASDSHSNYPPHVQKLLDETNARAAAAKSASKSEEL